MMVDIFFIFLGISILFFILLGIKELFSKRIKEKFCVICVAVSLTWAVLLILYWLKIFDNVIIIALLLGESILGIFYLVEDKFRVMRFFRLPFLLTLILIGYYLLVGLEDLFNSIIFLAVLWGLFVLVYSYKNNKKIGLLVDKIIKCCKEW